MKRGEIARSVTRGAFYLAVEKVAALVSGVAYFALLLRWLGPTKYGIMTLALSFAGLATMATGNFEMFLERFAAEYQARGELETLRRAHLQALVVKLALGGAAAILLVGLAPVLSRQFKMPELATLLPLLTLMVAFDGLSTTGRATLYGMQRFRAVCAIAVTFHVLKTLLVGWLWFSRQGLASLAIGIAGLTVFQGVLSTLVPLWRLRRARNPEDQPAPDRRTLGRAIFGYCLPLLGARVTFLSGQNLSKIVLGRLFDTTTLGYFSFAFQTIERFVEVVYTLPASLLPSLTHLVARQERDRLGNVFNQSFRLIQVAACALSLFVFVFAREITLLTASPLFEPAIPLLRIMALVPLARTAQQPLTMLFQALRRPGAVLGLALVKFAGEFGCYFTLVPALGMIGAGWANLVGAGLAYAVALVILSRTLPEGAPDRTRTVLVSIGFTGALLIAGWALDQPPAFGWSFGVRLLLLPIELAGFFALRLITRYDLEKLAALPVGNGSLRAVRDRVVAVADRLSRTLAPERVA